MGGDAHDYYESDEEPSYSSRDAELEKTNRLLEKLAATQDIMLDKMEKREKKGQKWWKRFKCLKLVKMCLFIGAFFCLKRSLSHFGEPQMEDKIVTLVPVNVPDSLALSMAVSTFTGVHQSSGGYWLEIFSSINWMGRRVFDVDASGDVWMSSDQPHEVVRLHNGRIAERFDTGSSIESIATHDGKRIFCVCAKCEKIDMKDNREWIKVEHADLNQISIGAGGALWGVDQKGRVWEFDENGKNGKEMGSNFRRIAVGSSEHIYALTRDNHVLRWTKGRGWSTVDFGPKSLLSLAVSENGDLFVLCWSDDFLDTHLFRRSGAQWVRVSQPSFSSKEIAVRARSLTRHTTQSTLITDDEIPTSPPPRPPNQVEKPQQQSSSTDLVFVSSKLSGASHFDVYLNKFGESELIATFPSKLRHVSISDDLITMVVGNKVFYQSWADRSYPLSSNRMYDDEIGAFLTTQRSWFLERRVLTVDTTGSCFVEGKCDYYDEKRNNPTFHSHRFEMMDVSHDGSVAWGITADDSIYEWKQGLVWEERSGQLVQISVGGADFVWGINRSGLIFEYLGGDKWRHVAWNVSRGKPWRVRVSQKGHVLLRTREGAVYHYDRSANKWTQKTEAEFTDVEHFYVL